MPQSWGSTQERWTPLASWRSSGTSRGLWKPLILFMRSTCVLVYPRGRGKEGQDRIALCCCSVTQLCLTLWDPVDCSTQSPHPSPYPGACSLMSIESEMPSNHLILCHPPSPLAFNFSQHQSLFRCVSSSHQVGKGLELQLQHQFFQWVLRTDFL